MSVVSNSIQTPPSQPAHGHHSLTLVQWLSALYSIQPLSQLTVLGVGSGYSEVLTWAAEHAIENVSLVEASPQPFHHISAKWQVAQPCWQLHNVAIDAGVNKANEFYIASNPSESGLIPPATLVALWPNIFEKERVSCEPVNIAEWSKKEWQSLGQWLFIDFFFSASLLSTYHAAFEQVDVLRVRVSKEKSVPKVITPSAWEPALKQAGFHIIKRECEHHPHIERWLCIKQPNNEKSALKVELARVREKLESTQTWFMNRKQQALDYKQRVVSLESALKVTQEELAQARQQTQQLKLLRESFDQLSGQVAEGFNMQSEQRQQATNALGKHITQMLQHPSVQLKEEGKDSL